MQFHDLYAKQSFCWVSLSVMPDTWVRSKWSAGGGGGQQRSNQLVTQELVMVSKKVTL